MPKVTKCPRCGSFFNSSIYSNCPYCQQPVANGEGTPEPQKTIKPSGVKGFLEKLTKKHTSEKPAEPVISPGSSGNEAEQDSIPETVSETVSPNEILPIAAEDDMSSSARRSMPVERPNDSRPAMAVETPTVVPTPLQSQLGAAGKTIGKFLSSSGETLSPVVGWIVGVKGSCFGQSFPIKSGKNRIARSSDMDIKLLNDESVSRTCVGSVVYDTKANDFCILPGESDSLTYVAGSALYERRVLNGFEEIEFGDSGKNKYLFVPLCGEQFQWSNYTDEEKE